MPLISNSPPTLGEAVSTGDPKYINLLTEMKTALNGALDSDNLAANSVGASELAPDSVGSSEIIEGTWTTPTLLAGASSAAGRTIQYYQDATGRVTLRGKAAGTASADGPLLTLPAGMRPSQSMVVACVGDTTFRAVGIDTGGNILQAALTNFTSGTNFASGFPVTLDGISFMP